MKLLQVYNQYRSLFNGEEMVVNQTADLIEKHGGTAKLLMRSSRSLESGFSAKVNAFWNGMYSREAYKEMKHVLHEERPDVVHVHNLYPLFSPSILVACRDAGVPVVMSIHNQQLTCPKSDHLYRGKICERCIDGSEFNCVLQNCRDNILESVAYAARSAYARKRRMFHDNITLFIALSDFSRQRLIQAGFEAERIVVLRNMAEEVDTPTDPARGECAIFAGRMSPEKGVDTLLEASRLLPECPVHLAGDGPTFDHMQAIAPANATLLGGLDRPAMEQLYRRARFLVLPSVTYEMCPLVILEAMSYGLPVITSRIGGQHELVEEGVTGLLFDPGDAQDLAAQMRQLWNDPDLCRRMGEAGREQARTEYSESAYYDRLLAVYNRAIAMDAKPSAAQIESREVPPKTAAIAAKVSRKTEQPPTLAPHYDVSVLMTVYNGMPYLQDSIDSILTQSLQDFRFNIIDDGSTDGTAELLDTITDPRVRVVHQENRGTAAAANRGLEYCDAEFTARMDADDISLPTRLEKQANFLREHPDVALVGTQIAPLGDVRVGMGLHLPLTHQDIFASLMHGHHALAHSSIMFRTELLKGIGGYWDYHLIDDWDMMLRMGEAGELANVDEVLHHYRVHRESLNGANMRRMRLHIAFACECARRRQQGLDRLTYEEFAEQRRGQPIWKRVSDEVFAYSLKQYRVATAEILGGHPLAGYRRLAWAAACWPPLTLRRLRRMI